MPQESTFPIISLYGDSLIRDRKTPSAIVDRQMLPRQTKRTLVFSDMLASVVGSVGSVRGGVFDVVTKVSTNKFTKKHPSTQAPREWLPSQALAHLNDVRIQGSRYQLQGIHALRISCTLSLGAYLAASQLQHQAQFRPSRVPSRSIMHNTMEYHQSSRLCIFWSVPKSGWYQTIVLIGYCAGCSIPSLIMNQ